MKIKKIRGTNDIYGPEIDLWHKVEEILHYRSYLYNYTEIRTPFLELASLFSRSVGENTEVNKQMYTFQDKKNRQLALKPEGTASIMRAVIENKLLNGNNFLKHYYISPMFRYERPQKNRRRQFMQFGIEAIGSDSIFIDCEHILLAQSILNDLNIEDFHLQINTIGSIEDRQKYNQALTEFLLPNQDNLSSFAKERLHTNPLKIFDSKDQKDQTIIKKAPSIFNFLGQESRRSFSEIKKTLNNYNIKYQICDRLVRGLDYYTGFVYEFVTGKIDDGQTNTDTLIGGGRYDNLYGEIFGKKILVPATGFAMGLDRIVSLLQSRSIDASPSHNKLDVFIIDRENTKLKSSAKDLILPKIKLIKFGLLSALRNFGYSSECCYQTKNIKKQFEMVNQTNPKFIIEINPDLLEKGQVKITCNKTQKNELVLIDDIQNYLKTNNEIT